jgi:hypothetical protein
LTIIDRHTILEQRLINMNSREPKGTVYYTAISTKADRANSTEAAKGSNGFVNAIVVTPASQTMTGIQVELDKRIDAISEKEYGTGLVKYTGNPHNKEKILGAELQRIIEMLGLNNLELIKLI